MTQPRLIDVSASHTPVVSSAHTRASSAAGMARTRTTTLTGAPTIAHAQALRGAKWRHDAMPESQFGQAPTSLKATLDELVALARHLRATPADVPERLTRLEGLAQMLRYFTAETVVNASPIAIADTVHCSWHDCTRTWRDFDACLLNFAKSGEPPLWLCRTHHPPLAEGGIRPPGWQSDDATREATEAARREALDALTREQLRLVNTRVGG